MWVTQVVFYGLPWLQWNDRQALLFDLASRKFYLFGLVLWPQDIIYLTAILIIAALALFLFTAVGGRLWCGYACPQTVYTEIFMWIEKVIEGDRAKRMRLDQEPLSVRKFALKAAKHGAWVAVALWTGFTFVGYFTPIRPLFLEFVTLSVTGWSLFWILFYGFATYGNAGWMREQVCKYMCPYARFQSAMFDSDTLIVTYDTERGEPRGAGSKKSGRDGARPRRLPRLQPVRAGVPDRHRHPQGAAVRVHRLRGLHRRVRPRDGEGRPCEGAGALLDAACAAGALRRRRHLAPRVPAARIRLRRHPCGGHGGAVGRGGHPDSARRST